MLLYLILFTVLNAPEAAVKTHIIDDVSIDNVYPAMTGPNVDRFVPIDAPSGKFWVTGIKVSIKRDKKESPQYLCHSRLIVAPIDAPKAIASNVGSPKLYDKSPLFGVSQGQSEVRLPKGFGQRVDTAGGKRAVMFGIQLQNYEKNINFKPIVKAEITYLSDEEGNSQNLRHLYPTRLVVYNKGNGHWNVPPGRHVYKMKYWPRVESGAKTVKIHYMRLHLHAFAEEFEIFDHSIKKSIWKAKATTNLESETLSHVDHFSSEEGLELDLTHTYELRAVYNNTRAKTADAMAYLTLFADEPVVIK